MSSYCEFAKGHELHGPYHDHEYGFPVEDESQLFERLLLEINQAGLSWELILKKRDGLRRAYDGFDVERVAAASTTGVLRRRWRAGCSSGFSRLRARLWLVRRVKCAVLVLLGILPYMKSRRLFW